MQKQLTTMIPIIGLAGPKGVGKTTLANMIVNSPECGQVQRDSFARTLKDMLIAMGVPKCNIDGTQEHKIHLTTPLPPL